MYVCIHMCWYMYVYSCVHVLCVYIYIGSYPNWPVPGLCIHLSRRGLPRIDPVPGPCLFFFLISDLCVGRGGWDADAGWEERLPVYLCVLFLYLDSIICWPVPAACLFVDLRYLFWTRRMRCWCWGVLLPVCVRALYVSIYRLYHVRQ